jgi:hypothetical protein
MKSVIENKNGALNWPAFSLLGFVDHPHSTFAQFFENLVMRNRLADHSIPLPLSLRSSGILKVATTRWEALVGDFGTSPTCPDKVGGFSRIL